MLSVFQPERGVVRLCHTSRCIDDGDVARRFGVAEIVEAVFGQCRRILGEVSSHEKSRFVSLVLHVGVVVVPVEEHVVLPSLFHPVRFECVEERLCGSVDDVESDEGDVSDGLWRFECSVLQLFRHVAIELSLVCQPLRHEFRAQGFVEREEVLPECGIAFAEHRFPLFEIREETSQFLSLFGSEETVVHEFLQFFEVSEDLACRRHVFVHVVKVRENALSPAIEKFRRECAVGQANVVGVESEDRLNRVCDAQR